MNQFSSTANTLQLQCNVIIATSVAFLPILFVHTTTYSYLARFETSKFPFSKSTSYTPVNFRHRSAMIEMVPHFVILFANAWKSNLLQLIPIRI